MRRKQIKGKANVKPFFFQAFGRPSPSKTAFEGPRSPCWANLGRFWHILGPSWAILGRFWAILGLSWSRLGLFGDILSHLGSILEARAFKIAPASWDCAYGSPKWPILARFGAIWEPILGAILGPNRPKRSQDGPKRSIKIPKVAKTYNCKNLKKPLVFQGFWGSKAFQSSF